MCSGRLEGRVKPRIIADLVLQYVIRFLCCARHWGISVSHGSVTKGCIWCLAGVSPTIPIVHSNTFAAA